MPKITPLAESTRIGTMTDDVLELIAARFKAMSEPMRLKILHILMEGEMTVNQLVGRTGSGQANISKHLSRLLEAGTVSRRKAGLCVYYSIADESIIEQCQSICLKLGQDLAQRQQALLMFSAQKKSSA
jgi:DNA-binding transcriptional ArsR family regulator